MKQQAKSNTITAIELINFILYNSLYNTVYKLIKPLSREL